MTTVGLTLNDRTQRIADDMAARADELRDTLYLQADIENLRGQGLPPCKRQQLPRQLGCTVHGV